MLPSASPGGLGGPPQLEPCLDADCYGCVDVWCFKRSACILAYGQTGQGLRALVWLEMLW